MDLTNKREISEYVVAHIDDAIENEWIKVYYQPVIRSLTGQLCGAESLARWIDSEVGFLSPDKFIGALEDAGLIHKLDCFVMEKVCKDIHSRKSKGEPVVPVSVNFSRHDFTVCNMLEVVESFIDKYDVPRDFIHVEITESMIAADEELFKGIMESFRGRGYEIWMDDFGSGYSSLNLLKDYQFDLLKMDMRFLSTMTDKSKTIVRSTITMAKRIGIKTLTEGVETQDQVDFLKSIGCGKLQGYYFGKPEPIDKMLENIESRGIEIEERQWRSYYEAAGFNARDTESPLEIFEFDGKNFKTLFMNDSFKQQIFIRTDDLALVDSIIYNPASANYNKYVQFVEKTVKSKNIENFYYTDKGNYYFLKTQFLAENAGKYLCKATITNISFDHNTQERDRLDQRLRELNNLFETVLLINLVRGTANPLIGGYRYIDDENVERELLLERAIPIFAERYVFADERLAFLEYMDSKTIRQRTERSGKGFLTKSFRLKQRDGAYKWRSITLLGIPGTDESEYLCVIGTLASEIEEALDKLAYPGARNGDKKIDEVTQEYARIWYNVMNYSAIMFFWKDKNRRFRGVSRSFLDFYEIKSREDIIGKNDEEMHWHVSDGPYKGDELDVLEKGKIVFNAPGQCIVNGVVHNIICNKMPIYERGEIVGLVGSFADVDQELYRVQKLINPSKIDNLTRLMNNRNLLDTMLQFAVQYNDEGRNYGVIVLRNVYHKRIVADYGDKYAGKVIREIGERIIECIGQTAAAGRAKEAYFCILTYVNSREALQELADRLKKHIEEIHSVEGKNVTVKMAVAMRLRTDEGVKDENIYQQALEEVDKY